MTAPQKDKSNPGGYALFLKEFVCCSFKYLPRPGFWFVIMIFKYLMMSYLVKK